MRPVDVFAALLCVTTGALLLAGPTDLVSAVESLTSAAVSEVTGVPAEPHVFELPGFLGEGAGGPYAWDPCSPVTWAVSTDRLPDGALADVRAAVLDVEAATGLDFVEAAPVASPVTGTRSPAWPDGVDLLVGWTRSAPVLTDGSGGTAEVLPSGGGRIDRAAVALSSVVADRYSPGSGPGATRGTLLRHELAHAVGLGHTGDERSVMFETAGLGVGAFTPGERALLRVLGGECDR